MIKNFLYDLAFKYIEHYEQFSYDIDSNGEHSLLKKLKNNFNFKVIFDVGANKGDWAKRASRIFENAQIHCFEISKSNFNFLKKLKNNNLVLNNLGLSDKNESILYKDYGSSSPVNTILEHTDFHDKKYSLKKCQLITGDSYCKNNNIQEIDFLKIDVEGAESLVLKGFKNFLISNKIKIIQFEYGYANGDINFLIKDFYRLLNGSNYSVGPLKKEGVIFMDFDYGLNNFRSGPNFIAISNEYKEIIDSIKIDPIPGYPFR